MPTKKKAMKTNVVPEERGTLNDGEAHPASFMALDWLRTLDGKELKLWLESYASNAMTGDNRLAEICFETLSRLVNGKPVSDRYILGLAWSMKYGAAVATGIEKMPKIKLTRRTPVKKKAPAKRKAVKRAVRNTARS